MQGSATVFVRTACGKLLKLEGTSMQKYFLYPPGHPNELAQVTAHRTGLLDAVQTCFRGIDFATYHSQTSYGDVQETKFKEIRENLTPHVAYELERVVELTWQIMKNRGDAPGGLNEIIAQP